MGWASSLFCDRHHRRNHAGRIFLPVAMGGQVTAVERSSLAVSPFLLGEPAHYLGRCAGCHAAQAESEAAMAMALSDRPISYSCRLAVAIVGWFGARLSS